MAFSQEQILEQVMLNRQQRNGGLGPTQEAILQQVILNRQRQQPSAIPPQIAKIGVIPQQPAVAPVPEVTEPTKEQEKVIENAFLRDFGRIIKNFSSSKNSLNFIIQQFLGTKHYL